MLRISVSNLLKFLIGLLLGQGATGLLVYLALKTDLEQTGILFLMLGLTITAVMALWFTSIADSSRHRALTKVQENFLRERESIRVKAEQEKSKEVMNARRQAVREKQAVQTTGHLKTGVMIGGVVGVGVMLMLTQFVTLGLLTLTSVGGLALGYGTRVRQERLGTAGKGLFGGPPIVAAIEGPVVAEVVEVSAPARKRTRNKKVTEAATAQVSDEQPD
jgi:hypothetical protein